MSANNFFNGQRCPICAESKGEQSIRKFLTVNNVLFEPQKEFQSLIGINHGNLSYDFYLQDYNLLIEYQGQYHDGTAGNQTEEEYIKQQEHDRRKRDYTKSHNIDLLEIWYYDFDNIEQILSNYISSSQQ